MCEMRQRTRSWQRKQELNKTLKRSKSRSQGRECIAPDCVLEEGLAGNPNAAVDAGEHSVDEAAVQSHAQEAEPALLGTAERTIAEQAND